MRQRTCDPQILKTLTFRPFTENNFFNSCSVLSTENAWQMKSSGPSLLYHLDIRHLLKELDFFKAITFNNGKTRPLGANRQREFLAAEKSSLPQLSGYKHRLVSSGGEVNRLWSQWAIARWKCQHRDKSVSCWCCTSTSSVQKLFKHSLFHFQDTISPYHRNISLQSTLVSLDFLIKC